MNQPEDILVLRQNKEGDIIQQHSFHQQDCANVAVFAEAMKKRFRLRAAGLTFRGVFELQSNRISFCIKDQPTWQAALNRAAQRATSNQQVDEKHRNNRPIVVIFRTQEQIGGPQQQMAAAQPIVRAAGTGIPLDDAAFLRLYILGPGTSGLNIPHHRGVAENEHPQYANNPNAAQQAYSQHWNLVFRNKLFEGAQAPFRELQRIQFPAEKFNGNDALEFLQKYKYTASGRVRTTRRFKTLAISMRMCSNKAFQKAADEDDLESTESVAESVDSSPMQEAFNGAGDEWGIQPLALDFDPDELGYNTLPHSEIERTRKNGEVHGVVPEGMEHTVPRIASPPLDEEDHQLLLKLPVTEGLDLGDDDSWLGGTPDESTE